MLLSAVSRAPAAAPVLADPLVVPPAAAAPGELPAVPVVERFDPGLFGFEGIVASSVSVSGARGLRS
jgi:hypothetical protein